MSASWQVTVLTLLPEMFPGPLGLSLCGKALTEGLWQLHVQDIRDAATDKHGTVDDKPYGGGSGMVLRADIADSAIEAACKAAPRARLAVMTPRGQPLCQPLVRELIREPLILLCPRFEGVDERVLEHHKPLEISLGDYVLSGGEIAAMAVIDAGVRLLPGVMGAADSGAEESFGESVEYACLLEYPHYTRPPLWRGYSVPEVLLGGDHAKIKAWRLSQAEEATRERRPDLWAAYQTVLKSETKRIKK